MKKIILIITLLWSFILSPKAIVKPTEEFYVNDYANILSNEVEEYIITHSKELAASTKAQIVVVTVPNLEGEDLETYANKLFNYFQIGDAKENNGLLLLLALEEREFRVEVGYGLEGVLTDGLTGRYQDEYIIPYLKDDNWNEGIKNGYAAFYKKICDYYQIATSESPIKVDDKEKKSDSEFALGIIVAISYGVLLGVLWENWRGKKKKTRKYHPFMFAFILNILMIIFVWLKIRVWLFTYLLFELQGFFGFWAVVHGGGHIRLGGGGFSSGGHSSFGGSGGGGRSGGGGSSRHF